MLDYQERQYIINDLARIDVMVNHLKWAYSIEDLKPILENADLEWSKDLKKVFDIEE